MSEVKLLRLKSGEDIVGVVEEKDDVVSITNPAQIVPMGDPRGGNVQMGFAPWCPFTTEKSVDVPKDWLVFSTTMNKDLLNGYNQMFGSGIVVPNLRVDTKKVLSE